MTRTATVLLVIAVAWAGFGGNSAWSPAVALAVDGRPADVADRGTKRLGQPRGAVRKAALQLIAVALAEAAHIDDAYVRVNAYCKIAEVQVKAGDPAGALEAVKAAETAGKPIRYTPMDLVKIQAQAGDVKGAKATAAQLEGEWMQVLNYKSIAEVQAMAGHRAAACETLKDAMAIAVRMEKGERESVYSDIAETQAWIGALAEATATAAQIENEWLRASAYMKIAEEQAKAGDTAGARDTLTKTKATTDSYTYCAIAKAQAEAGDVAGAVATAAQLDAQLKLVAYQNIAQAQAKAGDSAGACETFKKARAAAGQLWYGESRSTAYLMIVEAQIIAGDLAGANETAAQMEDQRYTWMMMLLHVLVPVVPLEDEQYKWAAYSRIAEAQATAGDVAGAKATAARIEYREIQGDAYLRIVQARAGVGDIGGAKEAATQIEHVSSKAMAYGCLAGAQAKTGDTAGARESAEKARAAAKRIKDNPWEAYTKIVQAQASAGDIAGARETVAQINDDSIRAEAYDRIAWGQAKLGDATGAIESIGAVTDDSHQRCERLTALAEELCETP